MRPDSSIRLAIARRANALKRLAQYVRLRFMEARAHDVVACSSKKGAPIRRFFSALLGVPVGYIVFAVVGYRAIELFSRNGFDRSVEASMTAAFVSGPAGAIVGLITGFMLGGAKWKSVSSKPPEYESESPERTPPQG
jgi:hypothetical protein